MPPGRRPLPAKEVREQIVRVWNAVNSANPRDDLRLRYYLLHRSFPELAIATLEAVIRADEGEP